MVDVEYGWVIDTKRYLLFLLSFSMDEQYSQYP